MQKSKKVLRLSRARLAGKLVSLTLFSFTLFLTACDEEDFPLDPDWLRPDIVVKPGGSIQAAVDAADPGEVILIKAGTYREAILVDKPDIALKGSGEVTIANPGGEEYGIRVTDNGDGFELYHVTLRNFEENGVFMLRADNYVLSHVTTENCGEYGLFPIASNGGLIEYCVASGHTDSGIYIGQCEDTEMRHNTAFGNVIGIEIENCSKVVASNNHSYDNAAGALIVLRPGLRVTTSSDILFTNNKVVDNNHVNFSEPGGGFENFVHERFRRPGGGDR